MKLKKIQGMRGGVRISLVKKNEFFFFKRMGEKGRKPELSNMGPVSPTCHYLHYVRLRRNSIRGNVNCICYYYSLNSIEELESEKC